MRLYENVINQVICLKLFVRMCRMITGTISSTSHEITGSSKLFLGTAHKNCTNLPGWFTPTVHSYRNASFQSKMVLSSIPGNHGHFQKQLIISRSINS